MQNKEIVIVHEYGAPNHYTGLLGALDKQGQYSVKYVEFSIFRKLVRSIIDRDISKLGKVLSNLLWLTTNFIFPGLNKNKIVVLGMAPLDWRIVILSRVLKSSRVIYHSSWINWDGSFFPKTNTVFKKSIETKWKRFLVSEAKAIAAVTPKTGDEINKFANSSIFEKTIVVYHSFNDVFINKQEKATPESNMLRVLFIGRIVNSKGIDRILELAARLPHIEFTFVGSGSESERIENLNFKNVSHKGFISSKADLAAICSEHDVILLPSLRQPGWEELFGISLIEAMATGCIPITTDHIGPQEILINHSLRENMISESDYVEHAAAVLERLSCDSVYREKLRLEARSNSLRFTVEEISLRWEKVLELALRKSK
ncbi:glycosyltransferase family 4 protein [Erwinia sp. Leaf53]|uniref:glycosyltransferase family 4 protein n=1 Tax=Erwinia sp. Leaf53 TaxID=1736225 RepID=UPI00092F06E2|nr:glycosyltransferase family 4 protein [Erwinia sp. Leaf53]